MSDLYIVDVIFSKICLERDVRHVAVLKDVHLGYLPEIKTPQMLYTQLAFHI